MSKEWQTGEVITATELNRMETDISGKLSEETDPIWVGEREGLIERIVGAEEFLSSLEVVDTQEDERSVDWYLTHSNRRQSLEFKTSLEVVPGTSGYGFLRTTTDTEGLDVVVQEFVTNRGRFFYRGSYGREWLEWMEATSITHLNSNHYTKTESDDWSSWETAHKGTTTDLAIAGTEVDVTAYFGTLAKTTFGSTPIAYNTPNDRFVAGVTGKSYSFLLNLRLSGSLSGSATTTSIFKLIIRRAFDNSIVAFKTFAKDSGAPTTFTGEDMISFITRVYGDTDPFVTGGFKLSLQRVAGNQTLTLNGPQQLFINK